MTSTSLSKRSSSLSSSDHPREKKEDEDEDEDEEEEEDGDGEGEHQRNRKRRRTLVPAEHPTGHIQYSNIRSNVRVVARIRPLSVKEQDKKIVVTNQWNKSILVDNRGDARSYDYDAVFGPNSTQVQVYQESGAKTAVCEDILEGFNCTILAYGQTGSGENYAIICL